MSVERNLDPDFPCHICGAKELILIPEYHHLPRITSDCLPWRNGGKLAMCNACSCVQNPVDEEWHKQTAEIYSTYQIYRQSAGNEQNVQGQGQHLLPRSTRIFKNSAPHLNLETSGSILDIGCANGELLRCFGELAPHWQMVGFEIDDKRREEVRSIKGVKDFFSGSLDKIQQSFDIITLVHVLEHLENPQKWLENLHRLFSDNGKLIIQLPDPKKNPFNLLVADHCTHFLTDDLLGIVEKAGYEIITYSDEWVPREFSLIATLSSKTKSIVKPSFVKPKTPWRNAKEKLAEFPTVGLQWLQLVMQSINTIPKNKPRGIWGTAIAATWVFSVMGNIDFFVDEDLNRVGQKHLGLPVFHPNDIPQDSHVFIALTPEIAKNILNRWSGLSAKLHIPPDMLVHTVQNTAVA